MNFTEGQMIALIKSGLPAPAATVALMHSISLSPSCLCLSLAIFAIVIPVAIVQDTLYRTTRSKLCAIQRGLTFTNEPDDLRLKHLTFWAIRYFCSRCSADILWQHIAKQE